MKKQDLIFIADCETSYINQEQINLSEKERERYADGIYIRNINESTGILFNNGKNTMKDFINYIIGLAKEYNKTQGYYCALYFHISLPDFTAKLLKLKME